MKRKVIYSTSWQKYLAAILQHHDTTQPLNYLTTLLPCNFTLITLRIYNPTNLLPVILLPILSSLIRLQSSYFSILLSFYLTKSLLYEITLTVNFDLTIFLFHYITSILNHQLARHLYYTIHCLHCAILLHY